MHWADRAFGWVGRKPLFFSDGWGDRALLERALDACTEFSERPPAATLDWNDVTHAHDDVAVRDGSFRSTCDPRFPLPVESHIAHVRFVLPRRMAARAVCVQLASTGDPGWSRRTPLARDLARRGVASVLLENPYYGLRKPPTQLKAAVRTVLDHVVMNRASIDEARSLLRWLREQGFAHLSVAGFSMGAQMAALTAASMRTPVACAPLGGGDSGERVFLEGVFRDGIDWAALDYDEARMREFCRRTAVTNLPRPAFDHGAVLVYARDDGFVHPDATRALHRHWPGSELRAVDGGHLSLFVRHRAQMVRAVCDGLVRLGAPREISRAEGP